MASLNNKFYTGVGSRETPKEVLSYMEKVASALNEKGYTLRSGGADGADTAFENGAGFRKEVYIPWDNFKNSGTTHRSYHVGVFSFQSLGKDKECRRIAREIHGGWRYLSKGAQALHSRNVHQVLGQDLETPSDFLVGYAVETKGGHVKGGTATAINLARKQGIPVYNLYKEEDWDRLNKEILEK